MLPREDGGSLPVATPPDPPNSNGQRSLGSHLKAPGSPSRGTWRRGKGAHATPARNAGSSSWPWTSARFFAHPGDPGTSGHVRPAVAKPTAGRGPRSVLAYERPQPPRWAEREAISLRSASLPRPLPLSGVGAARLSGRRLSRHPGARAHDGRCSSKGRLCFPAPPVAMVTGKLRLTPAGLDLKLRESDGKGAEAPVLSPTPFTPLADGPGIQATHSDAVQQIFY